MPFSQLNSHLAFCETRTEPCVKCGRRIQYRDIEQHARIDCTANTTTATVPSTTRTSATNGPIRNPISILFLALTLRSILSTNWRLFFRIRTFVLLSCSRHQCCRHATDRATPTQRNSKSPGGSYQQSARRPASLLQLVGCPARSCYTFWYQSQWFSIRK